MIRVVATYAGAVALYVGVAIGGGLLVTVLDLLVVIALDAIGWIIHAATGY